MGKFKIDIWFDQQPEKLHLGSVTVEAETEEQAYHMACDKTEVWVAGEIRSK